MTSKLSPATSSALADVFEELQTIDHDLNRAACAILECCDMLYHAMSSPATVPATFDVIVANITENCAFHDINSQRIHKIQEGLEDLLVNLQAQGIHLPTHILHEDRLASGPSRARDALSQEDVEALLNA